MNHSRSNMPSYDRSRKAWVCCGEAKQFDEGKLCRTHPARPEKCTKKEKKRNNRRIARFCYCYLLAAAAVHLMHELNVYNLQNCERRAVPSTKKGYLIGRSVGVIKCRLGGCEKICSKHLLKKNARGLPRSNPSWSSNSTLDVCWPSLHPDLDKVAVPMILPFRLSNRFVVRMFIDQVINTRNPTPFQESQNLIKSGLNWVWSCGCSWTLVSLISFFMFGVTWRRSLQRYEE
ncbi:hypothetical protein quinque_013876 [Culex quinquefasciatus]